MQPHKKHITEVVGSLSYTNLIDGFLAHELGHAVDFLRLAEHNGTTVASSLLLEELCEGYKQLPLATASSQAMEFWRTNRGGYRSCLETAGYTEETFMAALHNNTIAYNSIPQELRADMFALDIIKKVYSTTRAK